MTKIEKYFKEEITPNEAYDLLFEFVGYISLLPMNNQDDRINVYDKVMEFLNQPAKPSLTEDESVILRNINKKYRFIYRTDVGDSVQDAHKEGCLMLTNVSVKTNNTYISTRNIDQYGHLFQFIQPRRRI